MKNTDLPNQSKSSTDQTIEVPLEDFAFWQAQLAHSSARAENNPDYNGDSVHRAHQAMYKTLRSFHTDREQATEEPEISTDVNQNNQPTNGTDQDSFIKGYLTAFRRLGSAKSQEEIETLAKEDLGDQQ